MNEIYFPTGQTYTGFEHGRGNKSILCFAGVERDSYGKSYVLQIAFFKYILIMILVNFKIFFKVTAIVLISASTDILEAKPCELKKELDKISVDFTDPCKYDGVMAKSTTLRNGGIAVLAVNFFLLISILVFPLLERMKYKIGICIIVSIK